MIVEASNSGPNSEARTGTDRPISLSFSPEQNELRQMVRSYLNKASSESRIRELMASDSGFDSKVWIEMALRLGLQGLIVPERYGGSGATVVELQIVLEEMGRALLCAPYFSTAVLATSTLLLADDDRAMSRYLPSIVSGDCIATVALAEDDGDFSPSAVRAVAQRSGETFQLDGVKNYVLDGLTASLVIVPALLDGEVSLFGVVGDGLGLTRTPLRTTDQTRKQARLEFRAAEAELIGAQAQGSQIVREMLHVAAVGLAAEQVGGAQKCLDITVEYAKQRYQFGRAIGSFQAIKHKCADMLLAVESARSAAYYAGAVAVRRGDELGIAASLAKAYCSEVFAQVAADCIQVHGGMGFTWDHPASLYFKRAKFDELYLGDPASHAALIAGLLGL